MLARASAIKDPRQGDALSKRVAALETSIAIIQKKLLTFNARGELAARRDAESGILNKEFVDRYIDKISAVPADHGTMNLQIKVFNGTAIEKAVHKR